MTTAPEALGRLRNTQMSLEKLREDLSQALVNHRAADGTTGTELARLQDLHRRVSSALSALCGEVRER